MADLDPGDDRSCLRHGHDRFFTFWGLFPLVRGDRRVTGKNLMQHMLAIMNRRDMMGLTKADLIEGIEEPAGAMTAMLEAKDAVTLFI